MRRIIYPQPYPDPQAIPRPTTLPPPFPPQLTSHTIPAPNRPHAPSYYPLHNHQAFVNEAGEGVTDVAASHFHRVRDGRVLPDLSDGHYHELTGLSSGAGGAFRNFG
jgi:hypothetical protein